MLQRERGKEYFHLCSLNTADNERGEIDYKNKVSAHVFCLIIRKFEASNLKVVERKGGRHDRAKTLIQIRKKVESKSLKRVS